MSITPVRHPGLVSGRPHSRYEVAIAESTPASREVATRARAVSTCAVAQPADKLRCCHRSYVEPTPGDHAIEVREDRRGRFVLDSLGDDSEPEQLGEFMNRGNDRAFGGAVCHPTDVGAVDLHL